VYEQSEQKPHEQKVAPLTGIDLADDYNREVRHADAIQQHKSLSPGTLHLVLRPSRAPGVSV